MTNRLIHETSPYLRQHAHNPVDWHPWGDEALKKARDLERPIFLSIGYSACHWCHVMERESFEDPAIGEFLNAHYVNIKVDREERPDLDQIYMAAVQLLTQSGGWPMSVWLTPDLKPFYGGTYFPPRDLYGRPSFRRVIEALAKAWIEQRDTITTSGNELAARVQDALALETEVGTLTPGMINHAGATLARRYDARHGGFGQAPKFPHPMDLRLLLRLHHRFSDDANLPMAMNTLEKMARGGIYDQLGGGFHRYSTDDRWLVPHFEKMLYDNALLVPCYIEAFQITGEPFFRQIAEETLDYLVREMISPDGAFYSTQDADSEGEEGKFFVWSEDEVKSILGPDADMFCAVYDVTRSGNWEGVNVLCRPRTDEQDAALLKIPVAELRTRLAACKAKLLTVRSKRVWPGRDEKILTAWNGLGINAFAFVGAALDRPDYIDVARRAAEFVLKTMRAPDGRLLRTTFAGMTPKLNGYLEDYAYLIDSLVSLYEATFEPRWLAEASALANRLINLFWDPVRGGFFYTSSDHETLIARTKDPHDNATPSANSVATLGLLRLAHLTGRAEYRSHAEKTLLAFRGLMMQSPMAAAQMLIALDVFLGPVDEIAVIGPAFRDVVRAARAKFHPRRVLAASETATDAVGLLAGRSNTAEATLYVCRDQVCEAPIVGVTNAIERVRQEQ